MDKHMKLGIKQAIPFFLLLLVPAQALSESTIELHRSADIADIERLDEELTRLVAKVRQCAAAGLAPVSDCYCVYPSKLEATRRVYSHLLDKHPEWEDRSVLWWNEDRSYTSNLHLRGLRDKIEQPCS